MGKTSEGEYREELWRPGRKDLVEASWMDMSSKKVLTKSIGSLSAKVDQQRIAASLQSGSTILFSLQSVFGKEPMCRVWPQSG